MGDGAFKSLLEMIKLFSVIVDVVSIYNRELSEDEVKKNYDIQNSSSLNWKYYFENQLGEFGKELMMNKQRYKDIHKKQGIIYADKQNISRISDNAYPDSIESSQIFSENNILPDGTVFHSWE
ncbi:TPA: hypothetical protein ENS27_06220 [bacterium]|nr:hypothetical protein [bacterium]